jgi:hypothetical protein
MTTLSLEFGEGVGHRHCGGCTLCCKLLPVEDLKKPALTRCQHQFHKGCRIYADLARRAPSCHFWQCRWLADPSTAELHRPDRTHYVIDIVPDFVGTSDDKNGDGAIATIEVMQVWCDPAYPDAHRDPALRRYIEKMERERGQLALVRYGNNRAIFIVPPSRTEDGQWMEKESRLADRHDDWTNPMQTIHDTAARLRVR